MRKKILIILVLASFLVACKQTITKTTHVTTSTSSKTMTITSTSRKTTAPAPNKIIISPDEKIMMSINYFYNKKINEDFYPVSDMLANEFRMLISSSIILKDNPSVNEIYRITIKVNKLLLN